MGIHADENMTSAFMAIADCPMAHDDNVPDDHSPIKPFFLLTSFPASPTFFLSKKKWISNQKSNNRTLIKVFNDLALPGN